MMGKQFILDIVVVLVIPLLLVGGYYFVAEGDGDALLSLSPNSAPSPDLGAKTKTALETLNSIRLSGNLFNDPAFLSLKEYIVDIPSVDISRKYPFVPPAVIQARLNQVMYFGSASKSSSKTETTKVEVSVSSKIDALKGPSK